MQTRFVEDAFGRVPCKTFLDMAANEVGLKARLASSFIRKVFPNVYIRRSDRYRWYCGISVNEAKEATEEEEAEKIWMSRATDW